MVDGRTTVTELAFDAAGAPPGNGNDGANPPLPIAITPITCCTMFLPPRLKAEIKLVLEFEPGGGATDAIGRRRDTHKLADDDRRGGNLGYLVLIRTALVER